MSCPFVTTLVRIWIQDGLGHTVKRVVKVGNEKEYNALMEFIDTGISAYEDWLVDGK